MEIVIFNKCKKTGIIHQRLDYIFISSSLQESVKKTNKQKKKKTGILNALSSNHSLVFCSFVNNDTFVPGWGIWIFNNSLLFNAFVKKLKSHIEIVKSHLQEKSSLSDHTKRELLKYGIHKFSISFSKNLPKTEQIIQKKLENRIKTWNKILKMNILMLITCVS